MQAYILTSCIGQAGAQSLRVRCRRLAFAPLLAQSLHCVCSQPLPMLLTGYI